MYHQILKSLVVALVAFAASSSQAQLINPSDDLIEQRKENEVDWVLTWDDSIDGQVDTVEKRCLIRLFELEGRISGRFIGDLMGSTRIAMFEGDRTTTGTASIFRMTQVESNYQCQYQGMVLEDHSVRGVWHDTRGASGDFHLIRVDIHLVDMLRIDEELEMAEPFVIDSPLGRLSSLEAIEVFPMDQHVAVKNIIAWLETTDQSASEYYAKIEEQEDRYVVVIYHQEFITNSDDLEARMNDSRSRQIEVDKESGEIVSILRFQ